jgi:hypothetical protein
MSKEAKKKREMAMYSSQLERSTPHIGSSPFRWSPFEARKRSTIALLLPLIGAETCCCFQANGSLEHCCIVTNQMKWSPPTKMSISMHELYQPLKEQREDKNRKLISELTP